ncbi:MAG: hypothetical protein G01um101472_192 [Parcubacteria group bacterium Gr01-1014_72]|nr:MAG: hypothetical protein G01um101472_192 [Parcubacteria group bacterium Gr01-1014_72]
MKTHLVGKSAMGGWSLDPTIIALLVSVTALTCTLVTDWRSEKRGREKALGYPASPGNLAMGAYMVSASIVDIYPDRTNFSALLKETEIFSSEEYRSHGTNRLVTVCEHLLPGRYYRLTREGTNANFRLLPDPVRR